MRVIHHLLVLCILEIAGWNACQSCGCDGKPYTLDDSLALTRLKVRVTRPGAADCARLR